MLKCETCLKGRIGCRNLLSRNCISAQNCRSQTVRMTQLEFSAVFHCKAKRDNPANCPFFWVSVSLHQSPTAAGASASCLSASLGSSASRIAHANVGNKCNLVSLAFQTWSYWHLCHYTCLNKTGFLSQFQRTQFSKSVLLRLTLPFHNKCHHFWWPCWFFVQSNFDFQSSTNPCTSQMSSESVPIFMEMNNIALWCSISS